MKGAQLKEEIDRLNGRRDGLLSTSGNRHELAEILRANGRPVTLWSDVKAEWEKHNGHRRILTPEEWDTVHRMRDAVMAHPAACALLTGCEFVTEYSAYARDPETGVLRRVRPDLWRFDGIVGDLKTTEDASQEGFARSIAKFGYDMQHAYYLDTLNLALDQSETDDFQPYPLKASAFVFIVVEKKPPHAVAVYVLDDESVALGRAKYRQALDVYAQCEASGVWPGYGEAVQTISLPQWHMNQNAHLVGAA
jgi:exodeoxyribonuclease VIII